MKNLPGLIALCLALTACATEKPQPTPSPTPEPTPTPTSAPPTPAECELSQVLPQVDALLAGSEYEADYLTINHQLALSIWMVDPEVDPGAGEQSVTRNTRHAFVTGIRLAHRMASGIPCTRELFEVFNPMIVDRAYNGWYIDIIPMRAIPEEGTISDDDLTTAIEQSGMQIAYMRRTPPRPQPAVTTDQTCTWEQAHAKIRAILGEGRRNVSAYLIGGYQAIGGGAGNEPLYAQVQWDISSPEEAQQKPVLDMLEQLTRSMACLTPPVDRLETYVVDGRGRLMVYALIPSDVIQAGKYPLDPLQFTLILMQSP